MYVALAGLWNPQSRIGGRPPHHLVVMSMHCRTVRVMPTVIEMLSDRLRDRDPAVRLNSARQLAEMLDRFGSACLPTLLASLDTAAAEPPPRKAASFHHPLNRAWHTAAHKAPDTAAFWNSAMVDMLCEPPRV